MLALYICRAMGLFPLPGPYETTGPRIMRGPVFGCVNLLGSYGEPPQFARVNGFDRHPRAGRAVVEEEPDGGDLAAHRARVRLAVVPRDGRFAGCGVDLGSGAPRDPEAANGREPPDSGVGRGRVGAVLPDAA